jgi:branched-chain amino acid transport system permease protein
MKLWLIQTLNGLSLGVILFLVASGLSLIYGLMRIINLAHGSFYLLGGYIALTVVQRVDNLFVGMLAAGAVVAVLGVVLERFFLRPFYLKELPQVLMTFGFLFMFGDIAIWIWGSTPKSMPIPEFLAVPVPILGAVYPLHRLVLTAVGLAIGLFLWWAQERTRFGAMLRAAVDDQETARAMGINVSVLFMAVFALGAFLAAIAGVLGGAMIGLHPGADFEVMMLAFVVVIIGGLGSLGGALVGGIIVGLLDNFGRALFPQFALVTIFAAMVVILSIRPRGLFGREGRE